MDLFTLKLFTTIVQLGSFAQAARAFDVDASMVSRAMSALEGELGFRVFQRTTRRIVPTEAGMLYFTRIAPAIEEIERARLESLDLVSTPSGTVRVTTSVSFAQNCVVPLLPALRARYPKLAVELLMTDAIVDVIAERIDVAIRLGPQADSGLVGSLLMRTRYRVCASPAYLAGCAPIRTPEDLSAHDCVLFALPGYRERWKFKSAQGTISDVAIKGSIVISNALGIQQACLDGLGPALLPSWNVDEGIRSGALCDLFPDHEVSATDFVSGVWLLYPSRAYVPLKVIAFRDFLKEHLGEF